MAHESIPLKPPQPHKKPAGCLDTESWFSQAPEKNSSSGARKKVSFVEDGKENLLSKPTLNTSNELKKQIQDLQENADLSRILKEMRLSENVQAALNEEAARLLNYKLSDRKYTNLISLEDEIQPPILKHRSRPAYIGRKKDESLKPDVREFWSPEEFITEKPKMNFKVNLHDEDDVDEEEKESFDYLLDTYKRNECLPYQIFSTK